MKGSVGILQSRVHALQHAPHPMHFHHNSYQVPRSVCPRVQAHSTTNARPAVQCTALCSAAHCVVLRNAPLAVGATVTRLLKNTWRWEMLSAASRSGRLPDRWFSNVHCGLEESERRTRWNEIGVPNTPCKPSFTLPRSSPRKKEPSTV